MILLAAIRYALPTLSCGKLGMVPLVRLLDLSPSGWSLLEVTQRRLVLSGTRLPGSFPAFLHVCSTGGFCLTSNTSSSHPRLKKKTHSLSLTHSHSLSLTPSLYGVSNLLLRPSASRPKRTLTCVMQCKIPIVDDVKDENPVCLDPGQISKYRSHVSRCLFFSQDMQTVHLTARRHTHIFLVERVTLHSGALYMEKSPRHHFVLISISFLHVVAKHPSLYFPTSLILTNLLKIQTFSVYYIHGKKLQGKHLRPTRWSGWDVWPTG